ncbi:MAG: GTPase HflX [Ruminococcaceae bacterium]|nr:GTPase HflX [Oscillospiraceae bacterium]
MLPKNEIQSSSVVLVAILLDGEDERAFESSLAELEQLTDTAGGRVVGKLIQRLDTPNAASVIGSGKLLELAEMCEALEADTVIFDRELTPSQIRNIDEALGGVVVIDRTMLILDIFALHAVTGEGKLQVELAQLKYSAPRLCGKGVEMSRLGGGIGTRGPGESKLESDRRHIKRRIHALEESLDELDRTRRTMRAARDRSSRARIAVVGYTNAGKSTLLNRLTGAGVLVQNKLFATLDPTTRRFTLPNGEDVLITDTVGFISNLPHQLIKAFKSTLDEAVYADILMIVCDASDPECREKLEVTQNTLQSLGAGDKPVLLVYNKCDTLTPDTFPEENTDQNTVFISAKTGSGIDELSEKLQRIVSEGRTEEIFKIPSDAFSALNLLYKEAVVVSVDYGENGATVTALVDARVKGMLADYVSTEGADE